MKIRREKSGLLDVHEGLLLSDVLFSNGAILSGRATTLSDLGTKSESVEI